ncbi:MAG: 6-carboxytetrahydropterin synthase QueD, partial [Syntrophaceae bacterium]|nr:6-carboxytetrahydropterin synthase QueD [Syntrophaceae bacterium]
MFEVTIIKSFSAAHLLADIGGKCEELHGHNFKVEITVAAEKLNDIGILVDFRFLKKVLEEILEDIDHKHLNNLTAFSGVNPTAENIAKYIFEKMDSRIKTAGVNMTRVKIWESDNAAVTYSL